jgi:hypothetical protein
MYFLPKLKNILHTHKFEYAHRNSREHRKAEDMVENKKMEAVRRAGLSHGNTMSNKGRFGPTAGTVPRGLLNETQ